MASYDVFFIYDEGEKEFVESFSDSHDAYAKKYELDLELAADEDTEGVRVVVVEVE